MKRFIKLLLPGLFATMAVPAFAQMIVDPTAPLRPRPHFSGSFTSSQYDLDFDTGPSSEISRKSLGLDLSYPLSKAFSFVGQFLLNFDAELEHGYDDGSGFGFGGGVATEVYNQDHIGVELMGMFLYGKDTLKGNNIKADLTGTEVHLSGVATYKKNRTFVPYVGLDIIPMSDWDLKAKSGGKVSAERDDMLNLMLGLAAQLQSLDLRLQLNFMGEQSFILAAGKNF